ncbi:MAG: thioredoxin family protein [Deltaproteobacteria bacterium]|nr:thioredoxin family protein [Deltaproteobacteria bacterium]
MQIKVLGPGCPNCKTLAKRTEEAVRNLGIAAQVIKITDYPEMMKYDMLGSPGLVINDKLVMSGRVPTVAEITTLIANGQLEKTEPPAKCGCKSGCC